MLARVDLEQNHLGPVLSGVNDIDDSVILWRSILFVIGITCILNRLLIEPVVISVAPLVMTSASIGMSGIWLLP